MAKSFLCACVLAGIISVAHAAEPVHGLGFAAGQPSGVGLSFRKMSDNYGFQVTFGALSQNQDNRGYDTYQIEKDAAYEKPSLEPFTEKYYLRETNANLGILVFKVLHTAERSRFYGFVGGSIFYNLDTFKEYKYQYQLRPGDDVYIQQEIGKPTKSSESSNTIYAGAGIGMEFRITQNIRVAVEWPLTVSSEGDFVMYFPQAGLHYFF